MEAEIGVGSNVMGYAAIAAVGLVFGAGLTVAEFVERLAGSAYGAP